MKKIVILILVISLGLFLWNKRYLFENPSGVYVNQLNIRDTIKLCPNGRFEQVVYNTRAQLVYRSISKWKRTFRGIAIGSILLYDNVDSLHTIETGDTLHNEGMNFDGFEVGYNNGIFSISWKDYVDIPESATVFNRIEH